MRGHPGHEPTAELAVDGGPQVEEEPRGLQELLLLRPQWPFLARLPDGGGNPKILEEGLLEPPNERNGSQAFMAQDSEDNHNCEDGAANYAASATLAAASSMQESKR